jgi:hypothetical protein
MKEELKKIREERKKAESKEPKKPQKRSIEVIEYEDGSYALSNAPLWVLPLKKDEVLDAFEAWKDGSLEGKPLI